MDDHRSLAAVLNAIFARRDSRHELTSAAAHSRQTHSRQSRRPQAKQEPCSILCEETRHVDEAVGEDLADLHSTSLGKPAAGDPATYARMCLIIVVRADRGLPCTGGTPRRRICRSRVRSPTACTRRMGWPNSEVRR